MTNNDILTREIESWNKFEYALRKENRFPFHKMLVECKKLGYSDCADAKGENFSAESLFLILILQQHKMINELQDIKND
jgi:hypothetical protein